jgi:hypothetical protein
MMNGSAVLEGFVPDDVFNDAGHIKCSGRRPCRRRTWPGLNASSR